MHLTVVTVAFVAGFFAFAGWAALALLERHSGLAARIWGILAGAVLLLPYLPIGIGHATPATKIALAVSPIAGAAMLFPMLGPAQQRELPRSAGR